MRSDNNREGKERRQRMRRQPGTFSSVRPAAKAAACPDIRDHREFLERTEDREDQERRVRQVGQEDRPSSVLSRRFRPADSVHRDRQVCRDQMVLQAIREGQDKRVDLETPDDLDRQDLRDLQARQANRAETDFAGNQADRPDRRQVYREIQASQENLDRQVCPEMRDRQAGTVSRAATDLQDLQVHQATTAQTESRATTGRGDRTDRLERPVSVRNTALSTAAFSSKMEPGESRPADDPFSHVVHCPNLRGPCSTIFSAVLTVMSIVMYVS